MPFIIIDQGGPAIRQYTPPVKKGVTSVKASEPTEKVESHPRVQPIQSAYDKIQQQNPQKVALAGDIMRSPVISLAIENTNIHTAQGLLKKHNIKHLPITKDGRLSAITCEPDILRHQVSPRDNPKWIIQKVFAATALMDIRQLAHVMFDEHISSMPIIDDDHQLIGIVTRSDLLRVTSHYGPMEFWA